MHDQVPHLLEQARRLAAPVPWALPALARNSKSHFCLCQRGCQGWTQRGASGGNSEGSWFPSVTGGRLEATWVAVGQGRRGRGEPHTRTHMESMIMGLHAGR